MTDRPTRHPQSKIRGDAAAKRLPIGFPSEATLQSKFVLPMHFIGAILKSSNKRDSANPLRKVNTLRIYSVIHNVQTLRARLKYQTNQTHSNIELSSVSTGRILGGLSALAQIPQLIGSTTSRISPDYAPLTGPTSQSADALRTWRQLPNVTL